MKDIVERLRSWKYLPDQAEADMEEASILCQTEGRILTNDGGPDDVDHGPCPACNGECVVEVETQPYNHINECHSCKRMFVDGETCNRGGCPMGGDV